MTESRKKLPQRLSCSPPGLHKCKYTQVVDRFTIFYGVKSSAPNMCSICKYLICTKHLSHKLPREPTFPSFFSLWHPYFLGFKKPPFFHGFWGSKGTSYSNTIFDKQKKITNKTIPLRLKFRRVLWRAARCVTVSFWVASSSSPSSSKPPSSLTTSSGVKVRQLH